VSKPQSGHSFGRWGRPDLYLAAILEVDRRTEHPLVALLDAGATGGAISAPRGVGFSGVLHFVEVMVGSLLKELAVAHIRSIGCDTQMRQG